MDTAQLFSGVTFTHRLLTPQSEKLASEERKSLTSYVVEVKVTVERPRASLSAADFRTNDPALAGMVGKIPGFHENAKVSPAFDRLYDLKAAWLKERLGKLDQLISRHNYYDCETILEFKAPSTGRRMLLLKGDMDVNTDGSDGDRNVEVDGSSRFFQPQTSYRWKKLTPRENPFLAPAEEKLAKLKAEYAVKGLTAERNTELKAGIEETSRRIYDLKAWSFLVSSSDPSIVVPAFMLRGGDHGPATTQIGDYAVVLYGGRGYPAIVGDAGPSFKFGEGSMRLCKEINPQSSALARPVSDLNVAYIVFPGTAEEAGPPDLAKWHAKCKDLLQEVGLGDLDLHLWEDVVAPWPTPTPEPTPSQAVPEAQPSPAPAVVEVETVEEVSIGNATDSSNAEVPASSTEAPVMR